MPPAAAQSSSRALNAILPLITSGQAYEAHQKARTFASRYQKSNQYDTAVDVLFQSARELLKAGQQGSGTDLACLILDVYENKGENVNDESRGKFRDLTLHFNCLDLNTLKSPPRTHHSADCSDWTVWVMEKVDH